MAGSVDSSSAATGTVAIIAFRISDQEFCVNTTTIREIRGCPAKDCLHLMHGLVVVMRNNIRIAQLMPLAVRS